MSYTAVIQEKSLIVTLKFHCLFWYVLCNLRQKDNYIYDIRVWEQVRDYGWQIACRIFFSPIVLHLCWRRNDGVNTSVLCTTTAPTVCRCWAFLEFILHTKCHCLGCKYNSYWKTIFLHLQNFLEALRQIIGKNQK